MFAQLVVAAHERAQNIGAVVPYDGWLAERLRRGGVEPVVQPSKGSFNLGLARRLIRLMRAGRGELIHAHLLGSSVYAAAVGMIVGCPVVAVFHGATDLRQAGTLLALKRWLLARRHVTVVAVSHAVRDALLEWGVDPQHMAVIINGVDTIAYTPGTSSLLREELGLSADVRIVGAVGNVRVAKAYEVFVRAAARVVQALPHVHFVVAGQGAKADVDALLRLRGQMGIDENLHFIGFRSEGAALYQSLNVFASSASSEGLPLSFLEAMACGVPIAATANEGAQQLLTQTGGGLLSPVGDVAALAANIVALLSDEPLANALAATGRVAVERGFSLAATLENYAALCDRVTDKASLHPASL